MPPSHEAPRVLRLTFEFRVPDGLNVNIHGTRVKKAAEAFTNAMQAVVGQVFPWASEMRVRTEWMYAWLDKQPDTVVLPATDKNTPKT